MPHRDEVVDLGVRVHTDGVATLVEEAERTWHERAAEPGGPVAGPRPFEDAFPTFYQFSNRPQR
ncbi:MAG: hypothetical protein HOV79_24725 [Hamadaea sp.]|nr:hypothetical protein [Hamadaea sp.]